MLVNSFSAPPQVQNALDPQVERQLMEHRTSYALHYPPDDNTDHAPMVFLALEGLSSRATIAEFASQYRRRLVALVPAATDVQAQVWQRNCGRLSAYPAFLQFFDAEIAASGWACTLERYLPKLISGWVKDAYHALIRLSYGIEFQCHSEIAAGLAYLAALGPDPRLEKLAATPGVSGCYLEFVRTLGWQDDGGRFNHRYDRILRRAERALQDAGGQTKLAAAEGDADQVLRTLSRAVLEVFHATHGFFALHLVTGSHAFRVCMPWAGPHAGAMFSLGIATGYLAIGAPEFAALEAHCPSAQGEPRRFTANSDEHEIKICYSAQKQAAAFNDPTYRWVAEQYLDSRKPS